MEVSMQPIPVPHNSAVRSRTLRPVSRWHFLRGAIAVASASLVAPALRCTTGRRSALRGSVYPWGGLGVPVARQCGALGRGSRPSPSTEVGWSPDAWKCTGKVPMIRHLHTLAQKGSVWTAHEVGHSVHAEVHGLEPAHWYWYRFRVGDDVSPVGRTADGAGPASPTGTFPVCVASCPALRQAIFQPIATWQKNRWISSQIL